MPPRGLQRSRGMRGSGEELGNPREELKYGESRHQRKEPFPEQAGIHTNQLSSALYTERDGGDDSQAQQEYPCDCYLRIAHFRSSVNHPITPRAPITLQNTRRKKVEFIYVKDSGGGGCRRSWSPAPNPRGRSSPWFLVHASRCALPESHEPHPSTL